MRLTLDPAATSSYYSNYYMSVAITCMNVAGPSPSGMASQPQACKSPGIMEVGPTT